MYVWLEDTSLADVEATRVLEQVIKDVSYDASTPGKIQFSMYGAILDERASYSINVLVDLDGDGKMSRGDFINMESYPVITRGHPDVVSICVKRIAG